MDIFIENLSREEIAYGINRATTLTLDSKTRFVDQLISFHRRIFFDTHGFDNGETQSGYIEHEIFIALELLVQTLLKNYSLKALVNFYVDYHKLSPFKYGNNFVIRKFLVELSNLPEFKKVTPNGLDFRNVKGSELFDFSQANVFSMFKKITTPPYRSDQVKNPWPKLPTSSINISGYDFLVYKKKYFVGMNGGIIEISKIKKALTQFLNKGFYPYEYLLNSSFFKKSIFPDGLRSNIDGIDVSKECTLFCLDTDHLTNLSIKHELPKLNMFLRENKISILDLPELYQNAAPNKIVEKAIPRIRILKNKIVKSISDCYENKFPVHIGKPKFFMSMGGIGSGKSSLDKVARELTNNNFVLASIDLSRMQSDLHNFYVITNHHSDDYKTLVTFSYSLMGAIVNKAIEGNYNYFRDGSGIPYDRRNSDLIKIMKDAGYETHILVAAAALFKEKDREDITSPAHKRIMDRYKLKKRAVPWDIVIDKHVNHPLSQSDACCDYNVDKILIFDTMGKKGETALIGFTQDIPFGKYEELSSAKLKSQNFMISALKRYNLLPEHFNPNTKQLDVMLTGISNKYNFSLDYYEPISRILVIWDKRRMLDIIQKGALNIKAKGYYDLVYNTHKFHVPSVDYPNDGRGRSDNFRLRHQKL